MPAVYLTAGTRKHITVVSDGSHMNESKNISALLAAVFSVLFPSSHSLASGDSNLLQR
jgi:hypothetical protein